MKRNRDDSYDRDVTIVGGGWSVTNVAIDKLIGYVVAVNDAARYLPAWDCCVSMDRLWAEHRLAMILERSLEDSPPRTIWLRRSAVQNLPQVYNHAHVQVFDCDHTATKFSSAPLTLDGTNSGMCAMNLAWTWRPQRLFLMGFDMNRDPHGNPYWYPPYSWVADQGATTEGKYRRWAAQFREAAAAFNAIGTKVYNVSPSSSIDNFPKITPADYMRLAR